MMWRVSETTRRVHRLPVVIFVAGLAVFVVLAIACRKRGVIDMPRIRKHVPGKAFLAGQSRLSPPAQLPRWSGHGE